MKKQAFLALLLCLALLLAGCGGSANTESQASVEKSSAAGVADESKSSEAAATKTKETSVGVIEPEQLISKEEAEGLLGQAVADGEKKEQKAVGQKICFYDGQDDDLTYLQISITQQAFMKDNANTPESSYRTTKDALSTVTQTEVAGVGEEYFFGTPGLHILTDGYYLNIAAGNSDNAQVQEVLAQAGALAVKNLKAILEG